MSRIESDEDLRTAVHEAVDDVTAGFDLLERVRGARRRRVLLSRVAPLGGGVAVAAACALVVTSLGGTSPAPGHAPGVGVSHTPADPLRSVPKFGWLPGGFELTSRAVTADGQFRLTASYVGFAGQTMVDDLSERLVLTSSSTEPPLPAGGAKKDVSVGFSPKAYVVSTPATPPELSLVWRTKSGAWFSLGGDHQIHGSELETLLIKVGTSVSVEDPLPLPIRVDGIPKGSVLAGATLSAPLVYKPGGAGHGWRIVLLFTAGGTGFVVEAAPTSDRAYADIDDPQTVKSVNPQMADETQSCEDSDGVHICVSDDHRGAEDPLAPIGGNQGLLNRITSMGTDPAKWTTDVLRWN